jgi:hypothetical protein
MACLKNFVSAVQDWFGENLSRFNFYLMPLSFIAPPSAFEAVHLSKEEKNFLQYINDIKPADEDPDARYSVAVNVVVRFTRSKAVDAQMVRITNDPNALAIRLTEEQICEKYPWDYDELSKRCKERYEGFKMNGEYHKIRKQYENDNRFAHIRLLDPKKSESGKKIFFNPSILNKFDKHYACKKGP